jgi:hypothetical protein
MNNVKNRVAVATNLKRQYATPKALLEETVYIHDVYRHGKDLYRQGAKINARFAV